MSQSSSPLLHIRAHGPLACFTRPEFKVERTSYPVITPSAARGLLEAVLWKPAIAWHIRRIKVLRKIAFTSFRRNEVNSRAVSPGLSVIQSGGQLNHFFAEDERAQRNTVALRDNHYVVAADFSLTAKAGPSDNITKFVEMFQRRVEKGQISTSHTSAAANSLRILIQLRARSPVFRNPRSRPHALGYSVCTERKSPDFLPCRTRKRRAGRS